MISSKFFETIKMNHANLILFSVDIFKAYNIQILKFGFLTGTDIDFLYNCFHMCFCNKTTQLIILTYKHDFKGMITTRNNYSNYLTLSFEIFFINLFEIS